MSTPAPSTSARDHCLLFLKDASVGYSHQPVLSDLSLTLQPGERIAVIGKSGCGKSTLLRHLFHTRPQAGADTSMALLPQSLDLVNELSVFHNVYMSRLQHYPAWFNLRNLVYPAKGQLEAVGALLEKLELRHVLRRPAGSLSGGQKQRVAVARAIYQEAGLLLADEPVSALDEHQAGRVLELLSEHYSSWLIALHDTELALRSATRIVGIRDGRIAIDESSSRISPQDLGCLYV